MDFTQTHSRTIVGGQTGFAVPLIVAVTGHRDLVAAEVPGIRERVRTLLTDLVNEYPDRGVTVMTALAEGADQLVAEVALDLGIAFIAPLPMPREQYLSDFGTTNARERFEFFFSRAAEIYELPVTPGNTPSRSEHRAIVATSNTRSSAYSSAHTAIFCSRSGTARKMAS